MVEFGLKLEDNKVSEWNEYYINYEKLKAILKQAKIAQKKYDEQAEKRPNDALVVREAYKRGDSNFVLKGSTHPSMLSLLSAASSTATGANEQGVTEATPLLTRSPIGILAGVTTRTPPNNTTNKPIVKTPETKGIDDSLKVPSLNVPVIEKTSTPSGSAAIEKRVSALTNSEHGDDTIDDGDNVALLSSPPSKEETIPVIDKPPVMSYISDFFGSRFERNLRGNLKEIDKRAEEFDKVLSEEVVKVCDFYNSKLEELNSRKQLLIESVAKSFDIDPASITLPSFDENEEGIEEHNNGTTSDIENTPTSVKSVGEQKEKRRSSIAKIVSKMMARPGNEKVKALRVLSLDEDVVSDGEEVDGDVVVEEENVDGNGNDPSNTFKKRKSISNIAAKMGEADSIKRALIDQYRTAKLLNNFVIMNYTGFVKIVKKHDKTIPEMKGRFKSKIDKKNLLNEGKDVEKLSLQLERYFANWFCDGDISDAHAQMLPKHGDGLEMDWSQLRLGYRMGMCAVLATWVFWDCLWGLVEDGNSTIGGRSAFPVFRACGGILLLQWFWGCSVFFWTRFRVNYIYLFDFNPRIVSTALGIFEEAVDNTLVFMFIMLLYYKAGAHDIPEIMPAGGYPFLLVIYTTIKLIFPLRTRVPMWNAIFCVILPIESPSFFHGYVGDIFTSMVKVFQDIAWTIGWVFSGDFMIPEDLLSESNQHQWSHSFWYKNVLIPVICLLPLLFRFNQCLRRYVDTGDRFPHLANAFKYAMSQTVTLFGAFHPLYLLKTQRQNVTKLNLFQLFWMLIFVTSSLYSFVWDVYMDWGLGRIQYKFLSSALMYPRKLYYYSIIALDLVLRFMWVLTLIPPQSGARFEVPQYLSAITMMLELFRRTIWGFLRLENEHRSNAAGYRRVDFVPLHFHTGHQHHYKEEKQRQGFSVLTEVILVTLCVLAVCVFSVVAAQRATRTISVMEL